MKINEVIVESQKSKPMPKSHKAAMQNVLTFPALNMSTGSAYLNYRFGIALAGSPDRDMPVDNYIGGDPMLTTYTEEEMEIIKSAAKQMGVEYDSNWSGPDSKEVTSTNKQSPVNKPKKNKYGV